MLLLGDGGAIGWSVQSCVPQARG